MKLYSSVIGFRTSIGKIWTTVRTFSKTISVNYPIRKKVYIEVYGCQMNHSDSDIAQSLLKEAGYNFVPSDKQSDTILLMTCAIRDSAEAKIWRRIQHLRCYHPKPYVKIGVLGCMAKRLKDKLLMNESAETFGTEGDSQSSNVGRRSRIVAADFVCGPDSYRDLPKLIEDAHSGLKGASVALSLEETYADVTPVRRHFTADKSSELVAAPTAFISVMRGCDNMCTYCIVPFVRGRERSRPLDSILQEAQDLVTEGVREITLLGQNVNSYCDKSNSELSVRLPKSISILAPGFKTVYKPKVGGLRFYDLLDQLSQISPELRIRFTSPHPKDFPTEVLHLISERKNICSNIHLPAQSGSSVVLENMRRGYTRQAYMELVATIREIIPNVSLTSDFIAGFCGETEEDHSQTLELIERVGYSFCYCFPYSMREKTFAYHHLTDDVPAEVKRRRFNELLVLSRNKSLEFNRKQIGTVQLVLAEGPSRRSTSQVFGRNDCNIKVIFDQEVTLPSTTANNKSSRILVKPGDYVAVKIVDATSQTLRGTPLGLSTLEDFCETEWHSVNTTNAI
ncbi:CDK5 regulatory subunit-associated protein isoform 1 [Schistosoma japonicum]|uniref:CDK5 regulatory subunit-associated protein isoform 1 n=1 Tax=Schistosoma japonicum TaxID=6182 RepID=A0A4Z2DRU9_SCHJA|nr:CDK5 regulatory subunit-associated protein 1 [Schistosoma japonicum]TNN19195.1 CDK5 regulatory subunit-associated protein isoform 1 [Schistosoma japonicum]